MNHLIHIGFPRTGSTYLRYYFSNSPYFVHDMRAVSGFKQSVDFARYSYAPKESAKYFVVSEEEFSCWSGPDFNLSSFNRSYDVAKFRNSIAKTLKDFYGDATVLMVTRSHEAMVKSLYAQYVNYGGRMTFLEFIQSPNGATLKELLDYKTTVKLYQEVFGENNVIVLPYELMQDNTVKFMQILTNKLGTPKEDFSTSKINSSLSLTYLENSVRLSGLIYKLLSLAGKKKEHLFNYYAYLLMNRKFDWAFSAAKLFTKKVDLTSEYNSDSYKNYIAEFPSQKEWAKTNPYFEKYLSLYQ